MEEIGVNFMTRAELVTKSQEQVKSANRSLLLLLFITVVWGCFLCWLIIHEDITADNFRFIAAFSLLVCIYVGVIMIGILAKRYRRQYGIICPNCKKDLVGGSLQLAIASGRCGRCGAIILEDWNK